MLKSSEKKVVKWRGDTDWRMAEEHIYIGGIRCLFLGAISLFCVAREIHKWQRYLKMSLTL